MFNLSGDKLIFSCLLLDRYLRGQSQVYHSYVYHFWLLLLLLVAFLQEKTHSSNPTVICSLLLLWKLSPKVVSG